MKKYKKELKVKEKQDEKIASTNVSLIPVISYVEGKTVDSFW